ncbi:MAG TPA: glycoside hydrolase family 3 N-terminal domain-containing protein [Thermoleophilaceae bacterium]|nr:glycoside hydrolase family 3 N-terminal domain-containing protein [Thermoleophilaceae bacterium]
MRAALPRALAEPGREAGRRRLAALAAAALAALIAGIALGAGGGSADDPGATADETPQARALAVAREAVDRMSLRQQVGQVTVSSFPGTARPDYVRRRLRARETAGVILFGQNGGDRAHWSRLARSLQGAAGGRALVMVDQEGGDIRTVEFAGPAASQPFQGSPADVRRRARAAGRQLRAIGVRVNLAPVADVPRAGSVMATRSFAGDERDIAARTRASVRGLRDAHVAAAAKHFPGLGAATVNTDDGPATIRTPIERDLVPFRAAIEEDVPLIMLSHASYPGLDRNRIASQSHTIVTGLLRERLGFDGVIVTDSLEAEAVLARSGVADAAERSIRAGADLILMTGSASWNEVYPRLLETARRDPAFRKRIRASAARVLALKAALAP